MFSATVATVSVRSERLESNNERMLFFFPVMRGMSPSLTSLEIKKTSVVASVKRTSSSALQHWSAMKSSRFSIGSLKPRVGLSGKSSALCATPGEGRSHEPRCFARTKEAYGPSSMCDTPPCEMPWSGGSCALERRAVSTTRRQKKSEHTRNLTFLPASAFCSFVTASDSISSCVIRRESERKERNGCTNPLRLDRIGRSENEVAVGGEGVVKLFGEDVVAHADRKPLPAG